MTNDFKFQENWQFCCSQAESVY